MVTTGRLLIGSTLPATIGTREGSVDASCILYLDRNPRRRAENPQGHRDPVVPPAVAKRHRAHRGRPFHPQTVRVFPARDPREERAATIAAIRSDSLKRSSSRRISVRRPRKRLPRTEPGLRR